MFSLVIKPVWLKACQLWSGSFVNPELGNRNNKLYDCSCSSCGFILLPCNVPWLSGRGSNVSVCVDFSCGCLETSSDVWGSVSGWREVVVQVGWEPAISSAGGHVELSPVTTGDLGDVWEVAIMSIGITGIRKSCLWFNWKQCIFTLSSFCSGRVWILLQVDFYEKVRGKLDAVGRGTQWGQVSSSICLCC